MSYAPEALHFERKSSAETKTAAAAFTATMRARRSVRHFARDPVDLDVIRECITAAGLAPSGANKQPWTFCLVTSADKKRQIRRAAEEEEKAFYGGRAPDDWLHDLAPLGTYWEKPFLEDAPALIVVFAQKTAPPEADGALDGAKEKHYYVAESVGIACGVLLAALAHAGLCTLTHTPSPMHFLSTILARPDNERPYLLIPVGYPADDAQVPRITKKPLNEILIEHNDAAEAS